MTIEKPLPMVRWRRRSQWLCFVLVNMADNNSDDDLCRHMEAQEQTFKSQQEAFDNIQRMLTHLLENQNNNNTTSNEEENLNNEPPKSE